MTPIMKIGAAIGLGAGVTILASALAAVWMSYPQTMTAGRVMVTAFIVGVCGFFVFLVGLFRS